jgi:hypothetical protein
MKLEYQHDVYRYVNSAHVKHLQQVTVNSEYEYEYDSFSLMSNILMFCLAWLLHIKFPEI